MFFAIGGNDRHSGKGAISVRSGFDSYYSLTNPFETQLLVSTSTISPIIFVIHAGLATHENGVGVRPISQPRN